MKFCPICGSKMNDEMSVCPNCGASSHAGSAPAPQAKAEQQYDAAYANNARMGAANTDGYGDWNSGTIFIDPTASAGRSVPEQVQNAGEYAQVSGNHGMSEQDAWNDGTVFAEQAAPVAYPVHNVQQVANREAVQPSAMPMQAAVNPYQEKRIQTPYTPPVPKAEKQKKGKAPKQKAKMDGGALRDTVIRIVALVVVVACIVIGVITGGF